MSESSQITVESIVGAASSGSMVNFPNGIIIADPADGYYIGTVFVLPPSPFGPPPSMESRKIDMGGAQINILGNTIVGHMDVDDKMLASQNVHISENALGDGTTISNIATPASKSKIISYTLVFGDPPFRS